MNVMSDRLAVIAAVVACVAGCSAATAAALPAPEDLAPDTVAVIDGVPGGHGTITLGEFHHALELTAVAAGKRVPKPGQRNYPRLRDKALSFELEGAWIYGQADEWGISVTRDQVSRALARVKRQSFKSGAEYRAFLRKYHYTRRDVRERVEIELLSERLQERLMQKLGPGASRAEEQRFFTRFVREFSERWRARTVCAQDYAIARCSNGPAGV